MEKLSFEPPNLKKNVDFGNLVKHKMFVLLKRLFQTLFLFKNSTKS
jgi:hypothetical protein